MQEADTPIDHCTQRAVTDCRFKTVLPEQAQLTHRRSHPCWHVTRLNSLQKGVQRTAATPHVHKRHHFSTEHLFAYQEKTHFPITHLINIQNAGRLLFSHCPSPIWSCREERCTPANHFFQLFFLKTISGRYIYPLSYTFLIYAM